MSQQLVAIKKRIKSVSGAYKVTSAMKLVSTVKLRRWKDKMLNNKAYSLELTSICDEIFSFCEDIESPFIVENNKANKDLFIVVSSTLGLWGSYNQNVFKIADKVISPSDDLIILGNKGISHFGNFSSKIYTVDYSSNIDPDLIKALTDYALKNYEKGEYKKVHIIYSTYKNSLSFLPEDFILLPLKKDNKPNNGIPPLMEPTKEKLFRDLIDIYLKSIIHSKLLEAEVCEQAARSNAMENATKNAEDLLGTLNLEFNKARQAAITEEIVEIVAGSTEV